MLVVRWKPDWMPLCFPLDGGGRACPTSTGSTGPRGADILMVALLGALGGALTASLSIRNLKGTSTPYDVPVALATLKVPLGAFTAILALVAIQGGFVPGLSRLDSQEQILAYAVVFGFAQQALTRLLDRRAQDLMEGLPGGTATEPSPAKPAPVSAPTEPAMAPDVTTDTAVPPAGELPEDAEVLPGAADEAEVTDAEPLQTPEENPRLDLLPDQDDGEFTEDGLAETEAGPDAPDGVEFPVAETER